MGSSRSAGFGRSPRRPTTSALPDRPIPAGPIPAGPIPAGPIPAGPIPAGPIPAGPIPAGPIPAGPIPAGPIPAGPIPAGHRPARAVMPSFARALLGDRPRLCRKLRRPRRSEALATDQARGLRHRPLRRLAPDAPDAPDAAGGSEGRRPRQERPRHDQRRLNAAPARAGEPHRQGAASRRRGRTCSGSAAPPLSRLGAASCLSPSGSTSLLDAPSAGACRVRHGRIVLPVLRARPFASASPSPAARSRIIPTGDPDASARAAPSAWPKPALSPRSAASAAPATRLWRER